MPSCMCGTCNKWFDSFRARNQHVNALDHSFPDFECDTCEKFFNTQHSVEQHMNATGHWSLPYECGCCDMRFKDEQSCSAHEFDSHNYCADCNRTFQNANNLRMHLNSRIHRGTNITCPFCKSGYATATGVCHHLESGSCPDAPSLDRDQIYSIVRSKDPNGVISKNLIGWHGSSTFEATANTWSGYGYECCLCHRDFTTLQGLNQHLNSPIHQQALYHCPNRSRCGKEFKSLAGIINHLESESCGYTRFDTVQQSVGNVVSGNRLIAFR